MATRSSAPKPTPPPAPASPLRPSLVTEALVSDRRALAAACALYSTHQFGESLVSVIVGAAIEAAAADRGARGVAAWLGVLAADFVLLSLSYRFGARASQRAKQHAAHHVRMLIVDRAVRPDAGLGNSPGDLLTLAGSDATRIGAFAGMAASGPAAAVVLAVASALLLWFSLIMGAVILVCLTVLLIAVGKVSDRLRSGYHAEQQGVADAASLAEDIVRGLRVLRGIGAQCAASENYAAASRTALDSALSTARLKAAVNGFETLATGLYLVVVAAVGGWLALGGQLSLGHLVAALGLAQFLTGPLQTLFNLGPARARAVASAERVQRILDNPAAVHGPESPTTLTDLTDPTNADVVFDNAVGRARRPLDFTAVAGQITGLVLADPVAATDVPALLAREYDPSAGTISLGAAALNTFALDDLRRAVLVSFHDAALFPGTVAENIGGNHDSESAARAAAADQVISTLPHGWQSPIGEDARNLSGGQRQRLALARALAARPPILVLHDPTTAVDAATEDTIARNLQSYRKGLTTLIVSASPALLSRCDRVVYCDPDARTTQSTHADLLIADASYRTLVAR
jgi:putative ABC transport system ATP-binding protein